MSGDQPGAGFESHDDEETLEAELRQAVQQRRAALERAREAQAELERALARARDVLHRQRGG